VVGSPSVHRMPDHTLRIARLKMLYVAAKIRFHGNRDEVLYSMHEQQAAGLMDFLGYLDHRRKAAQPLEPQGHAVERNLCAMAERTATPIQ